MWSLIKGELRYNLDLCFGFFLFYVVLAVFLYIMGSGYLGQERLGADWIAYFILGVGIFFPLNIKLRWLREKRDRIHVMVPVSLHLISTARFFVFLLVMGGIVLCSLALFAMFHSLVPDTSTTFLSILAVTGFTMVINAVYFFLVPDLRGYVDVDTKISLVPLPVVYKAFRIFFICLGILVAFFAFLIIQIGEKFYGRGGFGGLLASLYKGIFQSWIWTVGFLAFGFCLFYFAVYLFEKRRSYVE